MMSDVAYESPVLEELAEPEWDRFINAITALRHKETKVVLKHFIWQVKRKMFGLPVTYHMMPVFFGPQEAGKSTVVRDHLCRPIKDFFASTDFATITDNRSHDVWRNYILFFDEMGRSVVSHLEDIKRKITEDTFNSRILTKNSDTLIVNRATFIGTTNKDISRLIFDDTGMRRFYQVDCRSRMDWSVTQTVDYLRLWRSVNEHKDTPLVKDAELLKQIKQVQASKRQITMMERWLRERPRQNFVEERILGKALFDEFVKFEQANSGTGRSETNVTQFGRNIKDIAMNVQGLELEKKVSRLGIEYRITYQGDTDLID
jgi:predicted P-loop ATPase